MPSMLTRLPHVLLWLTRCGLVVLMLTHARLTHARLTRTCPSCSSWLRGTWCAPRRSTPTACRRCAAQGLSHTYMSTSRPLCGKEDMQHHVHTRRRVSVSKVPSTQQLLFCNATLDLLAPRATPLSCPFTLNPQSKELAEFMSSNDPDLARDKKAAAAGAGGKGRGRNITQHTLEAMQVGLFHSCGLRQ